MHNFPSWLDFDIIYRSDYHFLVGRSQLFPFLFFLLLVVFDPLTHIYCGVNSEAVRRLFKSPRRKKRRENNKTGSASLPGPMPLRAPCLCRTTQTHSRSLRTRPLCGEQLLQGAARIGSDESKQNRKEKEQEKMSHTHTHTQPAPKQTT